MLRLLKFLDEVEKNINPIPVVAGIWPLVSLRNAEFLKNEVPGVEVPDSILERMSKAKTKEDGRSLGIEIAREIRDEISDRVSGFQVSAPFGIIDLALQVFKIMNLPKQKEAKNLVTFLKIMNLFKQHKKPIMLGLK